MQRISVISTLQEGENPHRRPPSRNGGNVRNLIAVAFVAMAIGVGATSFFGGSFASHESKVRGGIPTHFADGPSNQHMKGMLQGVNLLMEPEVADGLRLTSAQQESIEGVMVGASNSLSKTYEETRDQPPHVWYTQSQAVVNKALENILCSLTDEQVLQWRELMIRRQAYEKRNG